MSAAVAVATPVASPASGPVKCMICGYESHALPAHLKDQHGLTPEQYQAQYPGAEVISEVGKMMMSQRLGLTSPTGVAAAPATLAYTKIGISSKDAFGIGFGKDGNTDKHIPGYSGFTAEHDVPAVDKNYVFQKEVTRDVLMGMMAGGKIYASGPTGSGKTTIFEQVAARLGRPFYRQQFHGEMEPAEILGTWIINDKGAFEYLYSGLAKAIQLPSIVCLDEFDSGSAPVTAIANALLEGKPLVLSFKGGEKIEQHPDCLIVATGNTNGLGDETGLYGSTSVQSFATMNRFKMFVTIDYPSESDEMKIIENLFPHIPEEIRKQVVKVVGQIRAAFKDGKISAPLSTRQVINWMSWTSMSGDAPRGFKLAFMNNLAAMDAQVVLEIFQRTFGVRK